MLLSFGDVASAARAVFGASASISGSPQSGATLRAFRLFIERGGPQSSAYIDFPLYVAGGAQFGAPSSLSASSSAASAASSSSSGGRFGSPFGGEKMTD